MASGKSIVGEMFVACGAHLIKADQIAHELMQPGQAVYQEVVRHFGAGILNPDGTVSRPKLAEAAFGNHRTPSRVDELNRIVHPAVIRRQESWMDKVGEKDCHAVAIVEAALILEAGAGKRFDRLVVVTCRPEQRMQRFTDRMKLDEQTARQEIRRRMSAQLPDQEKIEAADYVIDNSGSLDVTEEQVRDIYGRLKGQAERDR